MTQDKITTLNKRLKEVKEKFEDLKKSGIDEDILIVWIKDKTPLPKGSVIKMLKAQEEFYDRLVKDSILDALE